MNDFEHKMIEAVAVLQSEMKHIRERLDTYLARQDKHDERLDTLERLTLGHGERLQALEAQTATLRDDLEPVRDGQAAARVVKWFIGIGVGGLALAAALARFWPGAS